MSITQARAAAVAETVARVRAIERRHGVTRDAIERIKGEVTALASRTDLFPAENFPIPQGKHGEIYRLSEDGDCRFALYASAGMPGKAQPPHNHTTWAVISGVYGDEHNVFYERTDNRGVPGQGSLRRTGELTVRKGNAVGFLPDDFHTIEVTGSTPSLHLHMYGLSLEELPGRIAFQDSGGGAYSVFPASPTIAAPMIDVHALKRMLRDGAEFALFDVREEGQFADGHLFWANPLPLSRLEMRVRQLAPRTGAPVVVMDGGDGRLARRAARRLAHAGYGDIAMLDGGLQAWQAAGYEVFTGINVPSKAFGEFVEHHDGTPRLEAAEIRKLADGGRKMIILDSRPIDEYANMNIPGGIDCPGAELVHRVWDLVPDPETIVVVNCAGRTRSIIGAQSLINAGLPNRVVALKNGTMGWHLAGFELERGATRFAAEPSAAGKARARAAADEVAARFRLSFIDAAGLARFEAESATRTLFKLDVRDPREYAAGHLPGFRSAPGGQLVQATDRYVGTLGARLVVACDTGTRSIMTASWLHQLGWEVHVLDHALEGAELVTGPEPVSVPGLGTIACDFIDPAALKAELDAGRAAVVDLDTSLRYRAAHIPGASWALRGRLDVALPKLPADRPLVLTSSDGVLARLAVPELAKLTQAPIRVLLGGTDAWRAAKLALESGNTALADETIDLWYRPYDKQAGIEQDMKRYLDWEVDLVAQVQRDGDTRFRLSPKPSFSAG
jgi:rhodanese-related sulfurtransferase/predicted metal-dependent enzyme (double-stranded beta helix superfamily)